MRRTPHSPAADGPRRPGPPRECGLGSRRSPERALPIVVTSMRSWSEQSVINSSWVSRSRVGCGRVVRRGRPGLDGRQAADGQEDRQQGEREPAHHVAVPRSGGYVGTDMAGVGRRSGRIGNADGAAERSQTWMLPLGVDDVTGAPKPTTTACRFAPKTSGWCSRDQTPLIARRRTGPAQRWWAICGALTESRTATVVKAHWTGQRLVVARPRGASGGRTGAGRAGEPAPASPWVNPSTPAPSMGGGGLGGRGVLRPG